MPTALIFYHFLYPDDVVSSVHMSELCTGLAARGWEVTGVASNRGCRNSLTYSSTTWQRVHFKHLWRPRFKQSSSVGRVLNAAFMIARWGLLALSFGKKPDIVIIGTDPVLSVLAALPWKLLGRSKVVHWCYDLYPEAAIAEGILDQQGLPTRLIKKLLQAAYKSCDLIVDLGDCMRSRLAEYGIRGQQSTILPWALVEPEAPEPIAAEERTAVFGDVNLALLYSGNFGFAHESKNTIGLARKLRGTGAKLVFSVRGNRVEALRASLTDSDTNIQFAPFAPESQLRARLSCADIHVVSLKSSWTGTVVPSKFFGALAIGRPVLFEGSEDSSIAKWIREHRVGWVLHEDNVDSIAAELLALAESPGSMAQLRHRCYALYQQEFSRSHALDQWDEALRALANSALAASPEFVATIEAGD